MMRWEVKKLGEVCTLQRGFDLPKNLREKGDYPLISSSGEIDTHCEPKVKSPGIVTGRSGSIGSLFFVEKDFWPLNTTLFVKDFHGNDPRFIFYLLKHFDLGRFASGTGVPTLNRNHVHDEKINITTSLEEQKRIVEILDKAFEGIAQAEDNTRRNLTNARELFDSYLNNIFTDENSNCIQAKLGSVCSFLNGFAFKSQDAVQESDVQLVRMGNLYRNILDLARKPVFYPNDFREKYSNYLLLKGDLIMSLTGTVDKHDYGYTVEIPDHKNHLLLNQRIAKIINISSKLDKSFFLYILRSRLFLTSLYKLSKGVRQANLSTTEMKNLFISFPTLEKQTEIVSRLQMIDAETKKLETIYQRKLEAIAELKQSILEKAFTGQLSQ